MQLNNLLQFFATIHYDMPNSHLIGPSQPTTSVDAATALVALPMLLFILAIFFAISIIPTWKIFTKAGVEGWKSIIPIYNTWTLFEIVGLQGWYSLLLFVPIVNIIVSIYCNIKLARAFGKQDVFALGLIIFPFIFHCILAFGSSKYALGKSAATVKKKDPIDDWVSEKK
ncbi:hypothetical protein IKF15_04180 [Candidatus Saccharibacteria bacterium]|nr:hypothetical protein [Candidatus Saccharibacteria bacterium]